MSGEAPEVARVHRAMAEGYRRFGFRTPPTPAEVEHDYAADLADARRAAWGMFRRTGLWGAAIAAVAIAASTCVAAGCWALYQLVSDRRHAEDRRRKRLATLDAPTFAAGAGAPPGRRIETGALEVSPVGAGGGVEVSRLEVDTEPVAHLANR